MAKTGMLSLASEKLFQVVMEKYKQGEFTKLFQSSDIENCVMMHAAAAGVAAMAPGVVPGVGFGVAGAITTGALWHMYVKICSIIGVKFGENLLKSVASAVLSNLAVNLAGFFAVDLIVAFIPGASIIACGVFGFVTVYVAGLLFLNILVGLFETERHDLGNMSAEELKDTVAAAASEVDLTAVAKEAKSAFTDLRKSDMLEKMGKDVDISNDETETEASKEA